MLTIRAEQLSTFSETSLRVFEERMGIFLATHFPDQFRELGTTRVQLLIQHGIAQARTYGIVGQRDVCQYIALMFVFGGNFDVNSNLSQLSAVLVDARIADPGMRIKALYATAKRELQKRAKQRPKGTAQVSQAGKP